MAPQMNRIKVKNYFSNRELTGRYNITSDYHQSYWNRSFGTGNYKFLRGNFAQNILPRTNSSGKVTKISSIGEKHVFLKLDIPKVPLAGCFNHFVRIWKKLTWDQAIFEIVTGYSIPIKTQAKVCCSNNKFNKQNQKQWKNRWKIYWAKER